MAKNSTKLKWCKVRLGSYFNWWVSETSDKVNWDADGLSVIDPRQTAHIVENLGSLKEYGLQESIVEKAFFTFAIEGKAEKNSVKIVRVNGSVFDEDEQYFLLPNNLNDEGSAYAEFLDHITALQIKMLNDSFEFEEKLTIEDLEDEVREKYNNDYMEGKAVHVFVEIMDILEYVPEGYSLEDEDEYKERGGDEEESYDDIDDLPGDEDESLEEDETMQWDEDENDPDEDYSYGDAEEEEDMDFDEDE
jgi:hypothetical protein